MLAPMACIIAFDYLVMPIKGKEGYTMIVTIPLTILLPGLFQMGVNGVFWAEPISNFVGGAASFITMLCTVWPALKEEKVLTH